MVVMSSDRHLSILILQISGLRQQLEAAKKHENQFKAIADGAERSMKEQEEVSELVSLFCAVSSTFMCFLRCCEDFHFKYGNKYSYSN